MRVKARYAIELHYANRGEDAMVLIDKVGATSKHIHGPDHNSITKEVSLAFELIVAEHEVANL